ncbi:copper-binding protein [Caulobacter mirabilis]|uniref:Copper-binding protein n=1 Tax=Caulobacter mirabilis TaxID=69666 RepID=A0A2D2B0R4_9CAUL|nr:copper-binding protein [Caulobacter mirabilis]ATQ43853.1 hypothetical protein CSW64_16340 [Caulobacter mirabilis]
MKFAFALVASLAIVGAAQAQDHGGHGGHAGHEASAAAVEGIGVVRAIDAKKASITINHEPIKALNWPQMTMPFKVSDPAVLANVKVGAKVRFTLKDKKITAIRPF